MFFCSCPVKIPSRGSGVHSQRGVAPSIIGWAASSKAATVRYGTAAARRRRRWHSAVRVDSDSGPVVCWELTKLAEKLVAAETLVRACIQSWSSMVTQDYAVVLLQVAAASQLLNTQARS